MYSLVSLLSSIYPLPAMHSLLVTLYVTEYKFKKLSPKKSPKTSLHLYSLVYDNFTLLQLPGIYHSNDLSLTISQCSLVDFLTACKMTPVSWLDERSHKTQTYTTETLNKLSKKVEDLIYSCLLNNICKTNQIKNKYFPMKFFLKFWMTGFLALLQQKKS